jgi:hypothetical protein
MNFDEDNNKDLLFNKRVEQALTTHKKTQKTRNAVDIQKMMFAGAPPPGSLGFMVDKENMAPSY